jgi:hypothetical protein
MSYYSPYIRLVKIPEYWSAVASVAVRARRNCPILQMVREKFDGHFHRRGGDPFPGTPEDYLQLV